MALNKKDELKILSEIVDRYTKFRERLETSETSAFGRIEIEDTSISMPTKKDCCALTQEEKEAHQYAEDYINRNLGEQGSKNWYGKDYQVQLEKIYFLVTAIECIANYFLKQEGQYNRYRDGVGITLTSGKITPEIGNEVLKFLLPTNSPSFNNKDSMQLLDDIIKSLEPNFNQLLNQVSQANQLNEKQKDALFVLQNGIANFNQKSSGIKEIVDALSMHAEDPENALLAVKKVANDRLKSKSMAIQRVFGKERDTDNQNLYKFLNQMDVKKIDINELRACMAAKMQPAPARSGGSGP